MIQNTENNASILVARAMLETAISAGWINGGVINTVPELAEDEKRFFIGLLRALPQELNSQDESASELSGEELATLFTLVCARAMEAVTQWKLNMKFEPEFKDILAPEVRYYADPALGDYIKELEVDTKMLDAFVEFSAKAADNDGEFEDEDAALLRLFEALKWHWRIVVHIALDYFENH